MIPGLQLPPALIKTSRHKEIKAVAYSTSDEPTIVVPANVRRGDLLVLFDYGRAARMNNMPGQIGDVFPAGFVQLRTVTTQRTYSTNPEGSQYNGERQRLTKSFKLADGSEGGETLTGISLPSNAHFRTIAKFLVVFRSNIPIKEVTPQSETWSMVATLNNPAAQTIAAAGELPPVFCLAAFNHSVPENVQFSSGGVDVRDGHVANEDNSLSMVWRLFTDNPVDITVDMPTQTFNAMSSGFFLLS